MNVFQSPRHYESHVEFYGKALEPKLIMPPTVDIDNLKPKENRDTTRIPFFGDLNYLKGGEALLDFAIKHPEKQIDVYGKNLLRRDIPTNVRFLGPIQNGKVLEILGKTKQFFCQPVWPEPSGRLAAEAFLSGCDIISNDRIGTFSFDFYPEDKELAIEETRKAPMNFWDSIANTLVPYNEHLRTTLGTVLVYKSYGGLGDIFFAIPAIYKLAKVAEELHFAVVPRLVEFFTKHLVNVKVVDESIVRNKEEEYDNIYELGNYPAFRGYDLPHALKYPTHKKVKQHAIRHYIDTVAKLHKDIDNHLDEYPYFKSERNFDQPYFVVHHGAGFLLKIWPTEKFAALIERLYELFPNLACKIVMGPNDPEIEPFFKDKYTHIEYITGGMIDVGEALSGALFHIGNDAGITHVAGSFDVPTVGVYGPTGPGSWGSFSTHNELIWGKQGVCNLRCNYDVILNCEHRICLTSVSVDRVLSALFKVLQKAYPDMSQNVRVNPLAKIEFGRDDCLIKLGDNELLLEYHSNSMKGQLENLLKEKETLIDSDLKLALDILKKQEILFQIPSF